MGLGQPERLRAQSLSVTFSHAVRGSASLGPRLVSDLAPPGAIDRTGRPGGTLVIALHGAVANRKTWLPLAAALPPEFELWCPDLPGHGSRAGEPFTLEGALRSIRALVAGVAPRPVLLAGDSLGGYLALVAAGTPGVAAVCAGGCTWTMTGASGMLARSSDAPARAALRLIGSDRMSALFAKLLPRLVDAQTARAIAEAGVRPAARSESLAELRGLDLLATVRSIAVPVAFVNGAWDWPTRLGETSLLRAARHGKLYLSRSSGHGVGIFDAPVFARAIVELAELI